MSLTSARGQLKGALRELSLKWERTKESWNDPASRAFEKDFLVPLEPTVRRSCDAMDGMVELLERARQECQ